MFARLSTMSLISTKVCSGSNQTYSESEAVDEEGNPSNLEIQPSPRIFPEHTHNNMFILYVYIYMHVSIEEQVIPEHKYKLIGRFNIHESSN